MIPTDPKEAANIGKQWGEVITDSVFGISDDLKKVKAKNQAIKARNELVKINNEVIRNNNLLRQQAMREIADEQERQRMARMSPAQKEAYKKAKAKAALEEHNRQVEAENTKQIIIASLIGVFVLIAIGMGILLVMRM
jgi:biotin carboxyl carrier protein